MTDDDRSVPPSDPADSPEDFQHTPVMLERVLELFDTVPTGLFVDATLGGAGHSAALLDRRPDLKLLGIDQDIEALDVARQRLARFGDRVQVRHGRFDRLADIVQEVIQQTGEQEVVGVLFDLGVSSPQLDRAHRGFSYRQSAPLDMRMDQRQTRTAHDVVNEYSAEELADVLDRYGDERFSRRIANAVVAHRPIETTTEFADIVRDAIPAAARRTGGHPAKRSFQAVRIEVNQELEILAGALDQAIDVLMPGGRCVVMSYHSGEDRIVKDRFRQAETGGCMCPPTLDCVCGAVHKVKFVRRGSQKASPAEVAENSRAKSVRLRAVESVSFLPRSSGAA